MSARTAVVSLLLPTRGRPRLAERFIRSAAEMAERPESVEVVLRVDQDDTESHALDSAHLHAVTVVGPRDSMGAYNTACLERAAGDIVVLGNDDIVIRTKGWDRRLREVHAAHSDGVYLAYPNDLFKGRRLCAFPILPRRTCDLLIEPFPRAYQGAFIDYHLLDIFRRLERYGHPRLVYLPNVVFEHMHYRTGKGSYDETYRSRSRFKDDATFLALRDDRSKGARRLLAAIEPARVHETAQRTGTSLPSRGWAKRVLVAGRVILGDGELPAGWRIRLFSWFFARLSAASVWARR